ncbi:hypothetical protein PSECIP111951_00229 [Pseudoalteromonas holothuriae]|uniref:Zn-ribbon motif protein n=1 Tax=Pseudoalteromonas holothuriae TaxID=2963714 RepID=A0A9W4R0K1_9GAMM|nr:MULTISPECIES: hypothetical protein [unclassified Pseudoalteromonas]CAH9050622.1 hypothetical protein PSECIP111951_00229 [Pseudoalteromonas sp. CIP111951]CAH9061282.1 hypothetical protein PSECIP111854_02776 [Pseudoalteromonas sp. CIP111854]
MAKPNKKGPVRTVDIYCANCTCALFKYRKGGKGALVKCFLERITKNHTQDNNHCPSCEQVFARATIIRGTPAIKFIGGKVRFK